MGGHVKDCCHSVGCQASTLSEEELCLVCGVVGWCGVVCSENRLAGDWGRMKRQGWAGGREMEGVVAGVVVEWKWKWLLVTWPVVWVAKVEVDVSETGESVAARWDLSRACSDIAVGLLATKHTGSG